MSTGQSYLGKGDSTTLLEHSDQISPQNTALADDLSAPSINPRIYEAQTRLLDLSDQFVTLGFEQGPMQAIGDMLTHWLTTPTEKLAADQLRAMQLLIGLLSTFYSATSQPLTSASTSITLCLSC
jgi:hypothetical protein